VLAFGCNSLGANPDTRYVDAWSGGNVSTASMVETFAIVAPRAGTLRSMFARHQLAGGNGNAVVYTVRVNGVNTLLTVTLPSGAVGQGSDLVNVAAVAQGDRITVSAFKAMSLGGGSVQPTISMELA